MGRIRRNQIPYRDPGRTKPPIMNQEHFFALRDYVCNTQERRAEASFLLREFRLMPSGYWKLVQTAADPYVQALAVSHLVDQRKLVALAIHPETHLLVRVTAVMNMRFEEDRLKVCLAQRDRLAHWLCAHLVTNPRFSHQIYVDALHGGDIEFANRMRDWKPYTVWPEPVRLPMPLTAG